SMLGLILIPYPSAPPMSGIVAPQRYGPQLVRLKLADLHRLQDRFLNTSCS
ncbi:hypothetical protein NPIL_427651, partial [Nephila pilipes]